MLEKGLGVKKDLARARRLYLAAAEQGNAKAMHNLAVLYAEGIDGKPDYATAVTWFRKAAQHGVADSQYNLGILYARGIGVRQDLSEAYKWFALAAARGDKESASKRDDVAGRLDAKQLAVARNAVEHFKVGAAAGQGDHGADAAGRLGQGQGRVGQAAQASARAPAARLFHRRKSVNKRGQLPKGVPTDA